MCIGRPGPFLKACFLHHLLPFSQDSSEKYGRVGGGRGGGERRLAEKQLEFPLNFELSPVPVTQYQRYLPCHLTSPSAPSISQKWGVHVPD